MIKFRTVHSMRSAYEAWAGEHGAPTLKHSSFGLFTKWLPLPKGHRGDRRIYRNFRFRPASTEKLQ